MLLEIIGKPDRDPPGLDPETYRHVRPSDVLLPHGVPWQQAAAELLVARS